MSAGYAVQSSFEVIAFILIIIGLVFEDRIAAWEQRMFRKIVRHFNKKGKITELHRINSDDKVC